MSESQHTIDQLESVSQPSQGAVAFRREDPRRKFPFLAGVLSLIPGLGQVYVGYYQRGFIHVLVAGSVLSLLAGSNSASWFPLALIFLIFFQLYNIIDAVRRATLYNLSLDGIEQIELPDDFSNVGIRGSFLGGTALVAFGLIALLHTAFGMTLAWLEQWWPLVPLLFGAHLIYRAYRDSHPAADD